MHLAVGNFQLISKVLLFENLWYFSRIYL